MKFPIVAQLMNIFQFLSPQWYVKMSCFHIVEILKVNCVPTQFLELSGSILNTDSKCFQLVLVR